MKKKLILVASPPACGKTYVSQQIAKSIDHIVYLDKDDLSDLLRAAFAVSGQDVDMDGDFYIRNLRAAEYSTAFQLAFSALRFEDLVILNAPLGKEVRDTACMRALKERANAMGAELFLIWVTAPLSVCCERMQRRNSDRDRLKLENWEDYVQKTNYEPPCQLNAAGAVDKLILFDNGDEAAFRHSLAHTLKLILGERAC